MPETIQQISAALVQQLGTWLEEPDEAVAGLTELRERLGALRGTIGAGAATEALRALSGSEKSIRASRQREAADAIARACRELGIRLEPGAPLKRTPRKKSAKPAAPQVAEQASVMGEGTTELRAAQ